MLLGIDGCRAGWLCVLLDRRAGTCDARVIARIDDILLLQRAAAAAIDIPIGLTESGPRACESEARRIVGRPRSSSIFPVPARAALRARNYDDACRIGLRVDGRKLSRQAWGILPKIRQVDQFLRAHPEYRERLREVHPEVSFCAWGGRPAVHAKKTPAGRAEREKLVVSHFGTLYREARARLPRGGWGSDDLIDAFAALWTAERIAAGIAMTIPQNPPRDRFGLRMCITY